MWKKIAIGLTGVALVFTLFALLFRERPEETPPNYYDELIRVAADVSAGYNQPVNAAKRGASRSCSRESSLGSRECLALIEAMTKAVPTLEAGLVRLDLLLSHPPDDVDRAVLGRWLDTARILEGTLDSSRLLIDGWSQEDQEKWARGWILLETLANEVANS